MPAKSGDAADVCQPSLDDRDYPISLSLKGSGAVLGYFGVIGYGRDFTPSAPPAGRDILLSDPERQARLIPGSLEGVPTFVLLLWSFLLELVGLFLNISES